MSDILGANVERLDDIAARFNEAVTVADNIRGRLIQVAGELQFCGRYGDEYRTYLVSMAIPGLTGVASSLQEFGTTLRTHADSQRRVSDGEGAATAAGAAVVGAAAGAGAQAAAPPQDRTPAGTAGRHGGDRYVVYADGVRTGGTRAWRNNNPGNIEAGAWANRHGAIGTDGRFAIFPDEATGRAAVGDLLGTAGYRNLSIADAIARYAPPHENDTANYTARVSRMTGLDATRTISTLNATELDAVVGAIRNVEGWRAGDVHTRTDGPDWARQLLGPR